MTQLEIPMGIKKFPVLLVREFALEKPAESLELWAYRGSFAGRDQRSSLYFPCKTGNSKKFVTTSSTISGSMPLTANTRSICGLLPLNSRGAAPMPKCAARSSWFGPRNLRIADLREARRDVADHRISEPLGSERRAPWRIQPVFRDRGSCPHPKRGATGRAGLSVGDPSTATRGPGRSRTCRWLRLLRMDNVVTCCYG
jgi:hypothetical protein